LRLLMLRLQWVFLKCVIWPNTQNKKTGAMAPVF
jgi:hypothetical protein